MSKTTIPSGGMFSGFANGVTAAHNWRLTSVLNPSSTDTAEFFTANLEQVDTTGQGTLGTVMSQSSGVFTFPSTGIWLCGMTLYAYDNANYQYVYGEIHVTTDNSSYTEIAQSALNGEDGSAQRESSLYVQSTIDVTNTTNVKVLASERDNLLHQLEKNKILSEHYSKVLQENLPKEGKK